MPSHAGRLRRRGAGWSLSPPSGLRRPFGAGDSVPLLLANGITSVRDMGGEPLRVAEWKREIAAGTRVGPHIRMAGPILEDTRWLAAVLEEVQAERDVATALADAGVWYTPTLLTAFNWRILPDSAALALIADSAGAKDPRNRYVTRAMRESWRIQIESKKHEDPKHWPALVPRWWRRTSTT